PLPSAIVRSTVAFVTFCSSRRVLKQKSSSVSHRAGCDDFKVEESGALSNRQYQLWVTLWAKG
ncbi:MAG: hypothetical protein WCD53_27655, partial [Microcoleus sp.]